MDFYNRVIMTSNSPLSRFESFARDLIEGSFDRLLGFPGPLTELTNDLITAARDSLQDGISGNYYEVKIHPATLSELEQRVPDLAANLEELLARIGERDPLIYAGELRVELVADHVLEPGQTIITAERSGVEDEPTAVLFRKKGATAPLRMLEAYLIVDGRNHVVIDKAVTSIGRSLDNDVILEDPGVSRAHAQIRWRNGRFVIFDLGSRSGTLINGRRLQESELTAGDVITLGKAALIYGEEVGDDEAGDGMTGSVVDITQELSADDIL